DASTRDQLLIGAADDLRIANADVVGIPTLDARGELEGDVQPDVGGIDVDAVELDVMLAVSEVDRVAARAARSKPDNLVRIRRHQDRVRPRSARGKDMALDVAESLVVAAAPDEEGVSRGKAADATVDRLPRRGGGLRLFAGVVVAATRRHVKDCPAFRAYP